MDTTTQQLKQIIEEIYASIPKTYGLFNLYFRNHTKSNKKKAKRYYPFLIKHQQEFFKLFTSHPKFQNILENSINYKLKQYLREVSETYKNILRIEKRKIECKKQQLKMKQQRKLSSKNIFNKLNLTPEQKKILKELSEL